MGEIADQLIEEEMFGGGDDDHGWEGYQEERRAKKSQNLEYSLALFYARGIKIKKLSQWHYRVEKYDFWPTTGMFMHIVTKEKGRGVFNLIRKLKVKQQNL